MFCLFKNVFSFSSLTTDACIQYQYSGCGGNANTFVTEEVKNVMLMMMMMKNEDDLALVITCLKFCFQECLDKCVGGGTTLFTQGLVKNPPLTPKLFNIIIIIFIRMALFFYVMMSDIVFREPQWRMTMTRKE